MVHGSWFVPKPSPLGDADSEMFICGIQNGWPQIKEFWEGINKEVHFAKGFTTKGHQEHGA